uniref:Secreted protein n=1 Tax=Phakopsora pachyrhizi TaxID=170000 RepID=A0A0S1MJ57_PHAPC
MLTIPKVLTVLAFLFTIVLAVEAEVPSTNDPTYSNQRRVAKNILTKRLRIETSDSDYRGGRIKDVFGGYYDPYFSGGPWGWK